MMRNRLVKDSFLILFTNSITYLAVMVNTRIISSNFSLLEYGYRAQILSIVTLSVSIFSLGLANCPNYFIPLADKNTKYATERITRNLFFLSIFVCVLMSLFISICFGGIVLYFNNEQLYQYKVIILIMITEQIFYSFYNGIQVSQHRAIRATLTNLIRAAITVVITKLMCITDHSMFQLILSTLVIDLFFCLFTIIDSSHPIKKIGKWVDQKLMREMLKYCIPLGISSITAGLCAQIDKLFVARFYLPDDLAIYSNMCTELPLAAISGAFIAVITPYVVKLIHAGNVKRAIELWNLVIEFVAIIVFAIIAVLFTFSKQAIYILYSEKYIDGYILFRVFILVEIVRITYFGLLLRAFGKSSLILLCSFLTLVLDVLLNCVSYFVFNAGLVGFAIATALSTFILQLVQLFISCKVAKVSFKTIFPWSSLAKTGVQNIIFVQFFGILCKIMNLENSTNILCFIPFGVAWGLMYWILERKRMKILYFKIKNIELRE